MGSPNIGGEKLAANDGLKNNPDNKEKDKKQILLRLSPMLWAELAAWADDDFRSINGQIEYLLSESVKRRKKGRDANSR